MSFRDQIITLVRFKRGDVNCLFSTSVGEEGLDIPDCNVIIRFDLFNSVIQYIQSRGRARRQQSKYIIMCEEGNADQSRKVNQTKTDSNALRQFCAALPEDRKITGFDAEASVLHRDQNHKQAIVPSTGAKLTFSHALEVLANFVATLPIQEEREPRAEYLVTPHGKEFICEILLPPTAPIQSRVGLPQRTKLSARCSAAFELCIDLIKKRFIDDHLRPTFARKLPLMRNARLAVSSKKQHEYDMKMKPNLWSQLGVPSRIFASVLKLDEPEALNRSSKPLILLTRTLLPELPSFPLFFGLGKTSAASVISLTDPIDISGSEIEALKVFTLRVFEDVFSKEYDTDVASLPYFLAPTRLSHDCNLTGESSRDIVDWEYLESTKGRKYQDRSDEKYGSASVLDKYVVDRFSGARKFFLRCIREDLKPLDSVPEGVQSPRTNAWKRVEHNIKEYSDSAWLRTRSTRCFKDVQPVYEAELVSLRRNLLDEAADLQVYQNSTCYIILEPLCISMVS